MQPDISKFAILLVALALSAIIFQMYNYFKN